MNFSSVICLLIYALFNFTIAHFLWNRVNSTLPAVYTSTLAFSIPFVSTIILSLFTNANIDYPIAVGLICIIIGMALIHRNHINSFNGTIFSIIILIMLLLMLPTNSDSEAVTKALTFTRIIISLFSIYWGFLFSRISSSYKELEKNIDKLLLLTHKCTPLENMHLLKADLLVLTTKGSDSNIQKSLLNILSSDKSINYDDSLIETYLLISRSRKKSLSLSEWIVTLLLSISIVVLSFITRETTLISSVMTFVISLSMVLCCLILLEQETKKEKLLTTNLGNR